LGLTPIERTVDLQFEQLRLAEQQIQLMLMPEARLLIAIRGFDPVYGATPPASLCFPRGGNTGRARPAAQQHCRRDRGDGRVTNGELDVEYSGRPLEGARTR
jgi:hypothetical protein